MPSEMFSKGAERVVYEGHVISLAVGTFVAPDGHTFDRDLVHHPGAVSVVPLLDDGRVVLVRQFRAALDVDLLEIPAGIRDVDGEAPEVTAARELAEEVGLQADKIELLCRFHNSPGFADEEVYVYLATGLELIGTDLQGVEEQHMTTHYVHLDEVPEMMARGDITDAKTIIGLLLARDHVDG